MLSEHRDNPVQPLLTTLDKQEHIDLDALRRNIQNLAARWAEMDDRNHLYESELQRELRAKIDLCGGVPGCPDSDTAVILNGPELLSARRAASLQFNRVFYMAPLTRNARKSNSRDRQVRIPDSRVHASR